MIRMALFCLAVCLCIGARAGDGELQLVGKARLNFIFWPIYDSRLYSSSGDYEEGERPLRLEIEYLRDIEASALLEHTEKEWRHLQAASGRELQWLQTLAELWPNISENDVLAMELDESERSTFLLNGKPLGSIDDPAFGARFLSIWLSPNTSRPDLRLALIGQK